MRAILPALLLATPLSACICMGNANACSAMGGGTLVFVGRVLVDSGEGWGSGPARVRVEERLANVPKDLTEVEVDNQAGTSCYSRLQAGERYVIFAAKDDVTPSMLKMGSCSNTFLVRGNEHILEALRNKSAGGTSRLVGTVRRTGGSYSREGGVPGATVVARSDAGKFSTTTDGFGRYEIHGVPPGRYHFDVSRDGFVPDETYNRRWSGRLVLNEATKTIVPDDTEPDSVLVGERSCEVRDLGMWPHGRISGRVTDLAENPLADVLVQAFEVNDKGNQESRPLKTARTDSGGRYTIEPLPGRDYIVGVNAALYHDADPYPPTTYRGAGAAQPARIPLADGERIDGIDLELPPKRTLTMLRVQVLGPAGAGHAGATLSLENLEGIQRFFSRDHTPDSGVLFLPVYIGEKYIVNASDWARSAAADYDYLGGSAQVEVTTNAPSVTVVISPKRVREPE